MQTSAAFRFALVLQLVVSLSFGVFSAEPAPAPQPAPQVGADDEAALAFVRERLFAQYGEEARRGGASVGTRLAWSLIRIAAAAADTRVDLASFHHDATSASLRVRHHGEDALITLDESDDGRRVRAVVGGYKFNTGSSVLLQKPLSWMAATARALRDAGISPEASPEWGLMEAPGGLIALSGDDVAAGDEIPQTAFFRGVLRKVEALPAPADFDALKAEFLAAAEALHTGVMGDETITPPQLKQALEPILAGTYLPVDPRDYVDNEFCRRLIEADYLEKHVVPLPPARAAELARYREALAKIEAGIDRFVVDLGVDGRLVAVSRPDIDAKNTENSDKNNSDSSVRDPETGENLSRHHWRWEQPGRDGRAAKTVFHSPLPSRYLYAMSVTEEFPGLHSARPAGAPARTEVWHAVLGRLSWYEDGAAKAVAAVDKWRNAVAMDATGGRDPNAGPLGWSFPLFVPVRNEQGDPLLIATGRGVVSSPDFGALADDAERRAAQDGWLDNAASVLSTPGELNLIYRIFFRYCSDSPLPELPNLIGSHLGLSDTHQTVYQTMDRRWAGRLIGDCDDMAEFFQNLAQRQGRLVHIMQLPGHAAAGWLDAAEDVAGDDADAGGTGYEFVVLQTGPALRFTAPARIAAVEKAYRHFDKDVGESQFSSSAVPLLLRFANEDTRTPFVLSARIYWDREYAEAMIAVQEYWHLHTFSAAIDTMERMIAAGDRDPGNLKELASLYEQVGCYDAAAALREEELATAGDDEQAALSTLLDMARLQTQAKNKPAALDALERMRERLEAIRRNNPDLFAHTFAYRTGWASSLARLGDPERAWALLRHDAETAERGGGRVSEPFLRILVTLYDRMAVERDLASGANEYGAAGEPLEAMDVRLSVRSVLSRTFGTGYFKKDSVPSLSEVFSSYYWLGRYGVATAGRKAGLDKLCADGPYPPEGADSAAWAASADARTAELSEEDWAWFRITPRLYFGLGLEMLDKEEYPGLYDPEGAKRVLACVARAADRGAAAGAGGLLNREVVTQSALVLSFLENDLAAFTALMEQVRGRNYSSLYDDAAVMFGSYAGLVPLEDFDAWVDAFHTYFPGRQNYFKAAYRLLNKGHKDHAVLFARRTAEFFSDDPLLVAEAEALENAVRDLRPCNNAADSVE